MDYEIFEDDAPLPWVDHQYNPCEEELQFIRDHNERYRKLVEEDMKAQDE